MFENPNIDTKLGKKTVVCGHKEIFLQALKTIAMSLEKQKYYETAYHKKYKRYFLIFFPVSTSWNLKRSTWLKNRFFLITVNAFGISRFI